MSRADDFTTEYTEFTEKTYNNLCVPMPYTWGTWHPFAVSLPEDLTTELNCHFERSEKSLLCMLLRTYAGLL